MRHKWEPAAYKLFVELVCAMEGEFPPLVEAWHKKVPITLPSPPIGECRKYSRLIYVYDKASDAERWASLCHGLAHVGVPKKRRKHDCFFYQRRAQIRRWFQWFWTDPLPVGDLHLLARHMDFLEKRQPCLTKRSECAILEE